MRFSTLSIFTLAFALGVAAQQEGQQQGTATEAQTTAATATSTGSSSSSSSISFVEPSGGFGGTVGGDCNLEWNKDTTGNWTNVQIDLMTGPDHLRRAIYRVATGIDATEDDSWTHDCPDIDTSSKIYFYRMTRLDTNDFESSRIYTDRFCIVQSGDTCDESVSSGRGYISGSKMSLYHQSTNSIWD